ncbi:MAG: UbiX family flavin prenyltransferase [Thermoplasmata archaeon]
MAESPPLVVGVTGSSGAPIAVALLRALRDANAPVALVVSHGGELVLREESGLSIEELGRLASVLYREDDVAAPIASGSRPTRGMVVVPCSSNTTAKIALGLGDTLVVRAAHVHLKERRKLILVPRETPLSTVQLEHLAKLSQMGVVVLDAAPPYYLGFQRVDEATDYLAGKILDQFEIPHHLYRGWKEGQP